MGGIAISPALPLVAVGLVITVPQLVVTCVNRHRVRREVKRRKDDDSKFAQLLKQRDPTWKKVAHIGLGVGVRGGLTAATMGVVGFEHVIQGFSELTHPLMESAPAVSAAAASAATAAADPAINATCHAGSHVASHAASHAASHVASHGGSVAPSMSHATASDPTSHDLTVHEHFKADHPRIDMLDSKLHKGASGLVDVTIKAITDTTGLEVDGDTNWHQLEERWHDADGSSKTHAKIAGQLGLEAVVSHALTPLQNLTELGVDKARDVRLNWKQARERERYEKLD